MDDCIGKPVHLQDLATVLEQWVGYRVQGENECASSDHHELRHATGPITIKFLGPTCAATDQQNLCVMYEYSAALISLEGDETLLHSLFEIFLETGPHLMQGLQEAIDSENRQLFQQHIHQLKGALFALHAPQQALEAERLESAASVAVFSDLRQCFGGLEHQVEDLMASFRAILREGKRKKEEVKGSQE